MFMMLNWFRWGKHFGYPMCCITYFARNFIRNNRKCDWFEHGGRVMCGIHRHLASSYRCSKTNK